ncbi:MAG: hypothetical protein JO165_13340 [Candidatus Eremiobacteraeota bacterium]|nr:hypothetical protein [Candidatus Eremiobacteraeota bacterium]
MKTFRHYFAALAFAMALIGGLASTSSPSPAQMMQQRQHSRVVGTITHVSGHLVTVQQSNGTIVIDNHIALQRQKTGQVAVGRRIVALGFWRHGTFYATSIH